MSDLEKGILVRDPSGKFKILRGGKLYDLPTNPKPTAAPSPKKLVDQILEKSGIVVEGDLKERFEEIIEAYSKDVRDKFETRSTLIRLANQGGMGFSAEQADLVIKLVKGEAAQKPAPTPRTAAAVPRQTGARAKPLPPAGVIPEVIPEVAPSVSKMPEMTPGVAEFVFSPADEAEILSAQKNLPKTMAGMKPIEIERIIKEILAECGLTFLPRDSRKDLENILLTNLKDIRDGFETRETLSRLVGPKGIDLTGEQLEKILSVTRQELKKIEEKNKSDEIQKIKTAVEEQKIKSGEIRERTVGEVKEKMDERWREITRKETPSSLALPQELVAPPIGVQLRAAGELPKISGAPRISSPPKPMASAVESVPSPKMVPAPVAPAPAKLSPLTMPELEEEKPKPLQIFKPVSPPQVRRPALPRDNRPRLDDVKYVPRLVGPVEELREMTLIDWRRLAASPAAAGEKIKEKIGILEREAFSKRIAGIKAWQESEVNKLYLEIGRESLQKGVPVDKVIAERVSAGKPTLTSEEYRAIMGLNRSLRY